MDEININFNTISKKEDVIKKYIEDLNRIKTQAMASGMNETEFNNFVLRNYTKLNNTSFDKVYIFIRRKTFVLLLICIVCFLLYNKQETCSILLRNIQVFIYPGMKMWRKLTLPIISRYPSLTEYYDESCLINNPLFQVLNLTCDPCIGAVNVIETDDVQQHINSTPFMFKMSEINSLTFSKFKKLYLENREHFKQDAFKIESTNKLITNLDDLITDFNEFNRTHKQVESHNLLRCNRMAPARILRKFFPKSDKLPNTGISLERFIAIDTPRAQPYRIPDTECANAFLVQGYGKRIIILRPTSECKNMCRTLSILLPPSYVLIYNWWYWKPISMPDKSTYLSSMTYVGSYC